MRSYSICVSLSLLHLNMIPGDLCSHVSLRGAMQHDLTQSNQQNNSMNQRVFSPFCRWANWDPVKITYAVSSKTKIPTQTLTSEPTPLLYTKNLGSFTIFFWSNVCLQLQCCMPRMFWNDLWRQSNDKISCSNTFSRVKHQIFMIQSMPRILCDQKPPVF